MLRCADSRDAPDGCCSIRTTPVVTPTINLSRRCCSAERIVDFLNTETLAGFAHVIATGDADLSEFSQVNHSEFSRSVAPTKVYVWHMILSSFSGACRRRTCRRRMAVISMACDRQRWAGAPSLFLQGFAGFSSASCFCFPCLRVEKKRTALEGWSSWRQTSLQATRRTAR